MRNSLKEYRAHYFYEVAQSIPKTNLQFVIVTHVLPDRPELLEVIASIAPIALVIAIPYSLDPVICEQLSKNYTMLALSLEEMTNPDCLYDQVFPKLNLNTQTIILEIGGYFAPIVDKLNQALNGHLIGVIEDTETGHRQYERLNSLPCPVISVARSTLKETEDFLVGNSCLFSTERLVREAGFLLDGKQALILGFGKVGRGLAHALHRKVCRVHVYDINPTRRILALSEGFPVPAMENALQKADLIFGATGNYCLSNGDFEQIKKGALLISCSSKKIEFDLDYLNSHYKKTEIFENYAKYSNEKQHFYLLAEGTPVNFLDKGVIGPVLGLVQGEIIFAIKDIIKLQGNPGMYEVDESDRLTLATKWLTHFADPVSGSYRNG